MPDTSSLVEGSIKIVSQQGAGSKGRQGREAGTIPVHYLCIRTWHGRAASVLVEGTAVSCCTTVEVLCTSQVFICIYLYLSALLFVPDTNTAAAVYLVDDPVAST